jgi:hypothetical protein
VHVNISLSQQAPPLWGAVMGLFASDADRNQAADCWLLRREAERQVGGHIDWLVDMVWHRRISETAAVHELAGLLWLIAGPDAPDAKARWHEIGGRGCWWVTGTWPWGMGGGDLPELPYGPPTLREWQDELRRRKIVAFNLDLGDAAWIKGDSHATERRKALIEGIAREYITSPILAWRDAWEAQERRDKDAFFAARQAAFEAMQAGKPPSDVTKGAVEALVGRNAPEGTLTKAVYSARKQLRRRR